MNTVTTINLAGTAFQVEDPGYAALKKYLDDAKLSLAGNPDAEEILGDIERAIAEKCRRFVSAHKNVISTDEANTIVKEMGPVAGEEASGTDTTSAGPAPKKLYRIEEGEWIGGVATGLAAYLDVDVTLIRIVIVTLTVVTSGGFALAYFLAWMIIPPAVTGKERAEAHGDPFNAQEIVNRVRAEYAKIEYHVPHWKRELKKWKHDLKRQHQDHLRFKQREMRRAYAHHGGASWLGELFGVVAVSFFAWYGYHHFPAVHDFLDASWNLLVRVIDTITEAIVDY